MDHEFSCKLQRTSQWLADKCQCKYERTAKSIKRTYPATGKIFAEGKKGLTSLAAIVRSCRQWSLQERSFESQVRCHQKSKNRLQVPTKGTNLLHYLKKSRAYCDNHQHSLIFPTGGEHLFDQFNALEIQSLHLVYSCSYCRVTTTIQQK